MSKIILDEKYCDISGGFIKLNDEHKNDIFKNADIDIPNTILGQEVSGLMKDFLSNTEINSIKLPTSLERIGVCSFVNCPNLQKIVLPEYVECVGHDSFTDCKNLKDVSFSEDVDFENNVFKNTKFLNQLLEKSRDNHSLILNNLLVYGPPYDMDCEITDNITVINDEAFKDNNFVEWIHLPDSVIEIGNNAFENCPYLEEVYMQNSVTSIGNNIFGDYTVNVFYNGTKEEADIAFAHHITDGKIDFDICSLRCNTEHGLYEYEYECENDIEERLQCIDENETIVTSKGVLEKLVFKEDDGYGSIVIIPEEINRIRISSISENAIDLPDNVSILYLPNTLRVINKNAVISNSKNLLTLRFNEKINDVNINIDKNAFNLSSSIKEIYLPGNTSEKTLNGFKNTNMNIYECGNKVRNKKDIIELLNSRISIRNTNMNEEDKYPVEAKIDIDKVLNVITTQDRENGNIVNNDIDER